MHPNTTTTTESQPERTSQQRTATVNLPFMTAQFRAPQLRMPRVHAPSRDEINAAMMTARSYLPTGRRAAYLGGLAVAAAFEVIEWPVAAAIGIGAALTGRSGEQRDTGRAKPAGEAEPAAAQEEKPAATGAKSGTARRRSTPPSHPGPSPA